ncbi:MAG: anti-sigma factor family protein [Fidelibacterota bacterium]
MDRYQFEDLISDYIENSLPQNTRKDFESYVDSHPDARELVASVAGMISNLHAQPEISVSSDFMPRLMNRINQTGAPLWPGVQSEARTWWGFTPRYAMLMSGLVLVLALIGYQLIPSAPMGSTAPIPFAAEKSARQTTVPSPVLSAPETQPTYAATSEDSTTGEIDRDETRPNFENRIQLVKNPQ